MLTTVNRPWLLKKINKLSGIARQNRMFRMTGNETMLRLCMEKVSPECYAMAQEMENIFDKSDSCKRYGMYIQDIPSENIVYTVLLDVTGREDVSYSWLEKEYRTAEEAMASVPEDERSNVLSIVESDKGLMYEIRDVEDVNVNNRRYPLYDEAILDFYDLLGLPVWTDFIKAESASPAEGEGTFRIAQFREMLVKAIGSVSKSAFAAKVGITPQHLSRLLNKDDISRPTTETLIKIAGASEGISAKDLFRVCGYDPGAAPEKKIPGDFEESVENFIEIFRSYVSGYLTGYGSAPLASREELETVCEIMCGEDHPEIILGDPVPVSDGRYESARLFQMKTCLVDESSDRIVSVTADALLLGHESKNGAWYLQKTSFSPSQIAETLPERKLRYEYINACMSGSSSVYDSPLYYETVVIKDNSENAEKLLKAIFSDRDGAIDTLVSLSGPGFCTGENGVDPETFLQFLKNHRATYESLGKWQKDYCEKVLDKGCDLFETTDSMMNEINADSFEWIIADIMSRETGVVYWSWAGVPDPDSAEANNRPCIYASLDEWQDCSDKAAFTAKLVGYAKELNAAKVEWMSIYLYVNPESYYCFKPIEIK